MKYILILLSSILLFASCTQKHFYSEYKSVNTKKWKSTDTVQFVVDIDDTNALYYMNVSVRHQKDYEFSNVWLNIFTEYHSAKKTFRLEVPLFKKDGKPYGESSGSLCTQTIPFQEQIRFPQAGKYTIRIVQLMRKDPLDGISDVGVVIDKQ